MTCPRATGDGGGRVAELPSGTVTFLFTDLEGSTRLWEEFPERMRAALARHDEILRDAVEQRDGHVVEDHRRRTARSVRARAGRPGCCARCAARARGRGLDPARAPEGADGPAHRRCRVTRRRLLRAGREPGQRGCRRRRTAARSDLEGTRSWEPALQPVRSVTDPSLDGIGALDVTSGNTNRERHRRTGHRERAAGVIETAIDRRRSCRRSSTSATSGSDHRYVTERVVNAWSPFAAVYVLVPAMWLMIGVRAVKVVSAWNVPFPRWA